MTGHISVQNFDLQDLTLTASPQGFEAELELEATITSTDEPDSLQYTKQLLSAPVPGAGISVSGIFSLGATLTYSVGKQFCCCYCLSLKTDPLQVLAHRSLVQRLWTSVLRRPYPTVHSS